MDGPLTPQQQADIILNRTNIALARSQRLIQSWLPAKSPSDDASPSASLAEDDDESAFKSMTEVGGIGSQAAYSDDVSQSVLSRRKGGAANDRLLDQILGRRAAEAHRKTLGRTGPASGHVAATPMLDARRARTEKRAVESEDEEDGRSAMFKSRKIRRVIPRREDGADDEVVLVKNIKGEAELGDEEDLEAASRRTGNGSRDSRKKPTSYLDELLSSKKSKKGKKKRINDEDGAV